MLGARPDNMRTTCITVFLFALSAAAFGAADAARGAEVLRRENCLHCHSLRGDGGNLAPDLARRQAHSYTPAAFTSLMWNHAPTMWAEMASQNIQRPHLSEADASNLFAYLYSVRFFDRPADAGRGKQVFEERHCAECHSLREPSKGPGNPVSTWKSLSDPILLVQEMWNHSSAMKNALQKRNALRVTLTGDDLADLTLYLQSFAPKDRAQGSLNLPDPAEGKALFDASCAQCHKGSLALDRRLSNMTLNDIAADMWNHVSRMITLPMVSNEDMRKILAYVWEQQYLGTSGNTGHGRKVFVEKRCAVCHDDPSFSAAKFVRGERILNPISMIPVLMNHGPEMLQQMNQRGIAWPRLSPEDVSSLIAYLNTKP
jgi:mono/diheme cytochrome c family protein